MSASRRRVQPVTPVYNSYPSGDVLYEKNHNALFTVKEEKGLNDEQCTLGLAIAVSRAVIGADRWYARTPRYMAGTELISVYAGSLSVSHAAAAPVPSAPGVDPPTIRT